MRQQQGHKVRHSLLGLIILRHFQLPWLASFFNLLSRALETVLISFRYRQEISLWAHFIPLPWDM